MIPFKVSVHIIEPGFHNTNMVKNINDSVRATYRQTSQQVKEEYGEKFLEDCKYISHILAHNGNSPNRRLLFYHYCNRSNFYHI